MSILEIELTPEMEQRLREKAKQRGLEAKAYIQTVVIQDLQQEVPPRLKHSIMELEGLGAEGWTDKQGALVDAQKYVNELRREWDHRS
ncbi:MAG: hypothetical protein ACRYFS_14255 [Janthinobacterium lividum]